MNNEEWKDIKNYEGIYQISNHGNVKSIRNNKLLRPGINSDGYYTVLLSKNGKQKSIKIEISDSKKRLLITIKEKSQKYEIDYL